jgi:hypothetical protein
MASKRTTAQIGALLEIQTPEGLAYALYTHHNRLCGALIRVFEGIYSARPDSREILGKQILFSTFFPLRAALDTGAVVIIANVDVPTELRPFPLFRAGAVNPTTKRVETWWLWDGVKEWKVGQLTEEQKRLPIRGTWNDTLLISRIVQRWRPEKDAR